MPGPFDGLRVIDLTTVVVGPYTSQFLGDLGADVIKVEAPEGDLSRLVGPHRNPGMTSQWMHVNRNKRSVVLDLKTEGGKRAMESLIRTADVFVHNMRPEPLARLGLDYPSVAEIRPDIVFCNIWGFGRSGPYAGQAAFDDVIQAGAGLAALEGFATGKAKYVPMLIADKTTALSAALAVSGALYHRLATGEGQEVEVPMFESMAGFAMVEHLWGESFVPALDRVGSERHATPKRWPIATKDGFICVLATSDKHWRAMLEVAGRPELMDDPRYATRPARFRHRDEINAELERWMAEKTTEEWAGPLSEAGVPCMPVQSLEQVVADPHLAEVGFWHEIDHPSEGRVRLMASPLTLNGSPASIRRPPPRQGEHTREILSEAGFDDVRIEELLASGAAMAE